MSIRVTIAALGAKIVVHVQHVTLQMTEVAVVIMSVFPPEAGIVGGSLDVR